MPVSGQAWTSSGTSGARPAQGGQDRPGVTAQPRGPPRRPESATTATPVTSYPTADDVTTRRALPPLNFKPVAAPNRLGPRAGPALPSVTASRQWDGSAGLRGLPINSEHPALRRFAPPSRSPFSANGRKRREEWARQALRGSQWGPAPGEGASGRTWRAMAAAA